MQRGVFTGELPEHPVMAPCGHIFERTDIEAHLQSSQTCPVDERPLTIDQLSSISITRPDVAPALLRATSFDSMLAGLRSEWDSLQRENHELRLKLATTQRELAEALYEVDAAKRVIAKLLVGQTKLPETAPVNALQATLIAEAKRRRRESRKLDNERLETASNMMERFQSPSRARLASVMDGNARFTAIDGNVEGSIILGTSNGLLVKISKESAAKEEFVVTDTEIVSVESNTNGTILVASKDNVFVVEKGEVAKIASGQEILTAMWHPNEELVIVVYRGGRWELVSVAKKEIMAFGKSDERYSCAAKHPDGVLLATGIEGKKNIHIWNLSTAKLEEIEERVYEMPDAVVSIDMSVNGKFLAIGCASIVRVVDLTKQQVVIEYRLPCECVAFDQTGYLLAVTEAKAWNLCCPLKDTPPIEFAIAECQFGKFGKGCFAAVTCDDCVDITEPCPPAE